MSDLLVAPCDYKAAKYAVENWHYSKRMPKGKLFMVGVWEQSVYIGCVLFGYGATNDLVKRYGLENTEGCELVRVALKKHIAPVTKILSMAIDFLKKTNTGLRLIVSFADTSQGHVGTIYQANNWIYDGVTTQSDEYIINGKRWHGRALRHQKPSHLTTKQFLETQGGYEIVKGSIKHRYLYPLDKAMRKQVLPLAKPYPKKEVNHA